MLGKCGQPPAETLEERVVKRVGVEEQLKELRQQWSWIGGRQGIIR